MKPAMKPETGPTRSARRVVRAVWLLLFVPMVVVFYPQAALAANQVITDADNGGQIHLKAGETFELRLRANPTTGYSWYIEPKSTPLLKLVHQSQTEPTEPGLGRPIFQVFTFEARRAGDGVLLLHYVRSWEKPAPDDEQFKLRVSIE